LSEKLELVDLRQNTIDLLLPVKGSTKWIVDEIFVQREIWLYKKREKCYKI